MKVAIHARCSSDNQRDASIADQLRICREFAARQGWTVVHEFTDPAISGAMLLRSGFQALMRDALKWRFDVVLAECGSPTRTDADRRLPAGCAATGRGARHPRGHCAGGDARSKRAAQQRQLVPMEGGLRIELNGNLAAMLSAAQMRRGRLRATCRCK